VDASRGPLTGKRLNDRYLLQEMLGQGGMGAVYRSIDSHAQGPEKIVAVKILTYEGSDPESARRASRRFEKEAEVLLAIDHPNVIRVSDARHDGGLLYFVMEYLEGRSLRDDMKRQRRYNWEQTKGIALQIAMGLKAAHGPENKGIIHRDLKPENIFLDIKSGADVVKILDFGVAKIMDENLRGTTLTVRGSTIGTPQYMAPEQATGDEIDHRVDIYALGIIMYQLVTGVPPFTGTKNQEIMLKQVNEMPALPSAKAPEYGIPYEADEMIMRMLAKKREHRFQDMGDVIEILRSDRSREDPSRVRLAEMPKHEDEDLVGRVERVLSQTRTERKKKGGRLKSVLVGTVAFMGVAGTGIYGDQRMGYLQGAPSVPSVVEKVEEEFKAAASGTRKQPEARSSFTISLSAGVPEALVSVSKLDADGKRGQEKELGRTDKAGDLRTDIARGLVELVIRKEGYEDKRVSLHVDKDASIEVTLMRKGRRHRR